MSQISEKDAKAFEKRLKRQRKGGAIKGIASTIIGLAVLWFIYTHFIAG